MNIMRRRRHGVGALNTASLPDLIFTVLFFFMMVTHMRTSAPLVDVQQPRGSQLQNQSSPTDHYLFIGQRDGQWQIQLDDRLCTPDELPQLLGRLTDAEETAPTIVIKAHRQVPMSIVFNVREQLRRARLLNVRYDADEANTLSGQ